MLHKNPKWKPTKKGETWQGYIRFAGKFECPYSDKRGRVFEHRYVWWKKYGDKNIIKKDESLHHINGVKADNRIENLQKVKTNEHPKLHRKRTKEEIKEYKKNWRIKNKDKINKKRRRKREENLFEIRRKEAEYRKNNRDKQNVNQKTYREKNRDKINRKKKLYYQKNKKEILKKQLAIRKARKEKTKHLNT